MADEGKALQSERPAVTTPTEPKHHARHHRGVDALPSSSFETGRFGRMFRHLPVFAQQPEHLRKLAEKMISSGRPKDNPEIPSGYTYLGQFIDHDITFDPVSSLQRQNDPDALHNFRTPRFDLDSLYGRGPSDQPYLYENVDDITLMKLGEDVNVADDEASAGPDLPRNEPRQRDGEDVFFGRALIGDPRNDENTIVSQLHLTFLKFHNRVVKHVADTTPLRGDDLFKEAQRLVRWHYQWVVVHDFLRRIVGDAVVDDILRAETYVAGVSGEAVTILRPHLQFYKPREQAFMPVEFSVAAYRFGHSMIRGRYDINTFVKNARADEGPIPVFGDEQPPDEFKNLNGFRRLPPQWGIEWKFFFEMPGADIQPQASLEIDPLLAGPLAKLPPSVASDPPPSLAQRNLERGLRLGLPAGTTVARAMGIEPLEAAQLDVGHISDEIAMHPPLWYYVLKEAEVLAGARKLGPVGGRIVAEVLLGLLDNDPLSYLSVEPGWQPAAPLARDDGTFDMPQLIRFALEP